jgi:hypothetical protein
MGEIAERYRRRAAELEPDARAAYKRIAGRRWESLQRRFEEQQLRQASPLSSSDGDSLSAPPSPNGG